MSSTTTELAKERSREAANRTLMAWIRTALSLIAFGFGIAKFYHYLKSQDLHESVDPSASALLVGGSFIVLGLVGLTAGVVQHHNILKRIAREEFVYATPWPIARSVAIALLLIGAVALVGAIN